MKRPNGQGSIYFETAKNRYAASFVTPEGKRVVKRFHTKEEAENWLEDNRYKIRHNTFVSPNTIKTGAWIIQYVETYKKNVRPSTMNLYISTMKQIDPIANIPLQKLTGLDVQSFINSLTGKISASYIKKVYQLLNMAIKKAVALGILQKNPLTTVERPKVITKKIQVFTIDEIHNILEYTKEKQKRLHMEILVGVYTGMRIGEILSLSWSDITPSYIIVNKTLSAGLHGELFIQRAPKTDSSCRQISIPSSLYETLMEYKEKTHTHDGLVFKTSTGHYVVPCNDRIAFRKVQSALNISPLRSWHALRHTHASQLLANNVPIAEVAKRLGHASPAITLQIYTQWIPGNDEKVALDVDRIFK